MGRFGDGGRPGLLLGRLVKGNPRSSGDWWRGNRGPLRFFERCRTTSFFWAIRAADSGQRASGPGRTKYSSMGPCAIAARELCPIYFNLDVSALVYRGDCNLRLPLRLNLHCKTGLSWRVPSKLLAMARARAQRRRADHSACFGSHGVCAKNACTLVYGHPRACVDCPEWYFEPSRKKSCETRTTW